MKYLKLPDKLPWTMVIVFVITLGLAPFSPPHILEKLQLLFNAQHLKSIDWFDLFSRFSVDNSHKQS